MREHITVTITDPRVIDYIDMYKRCTFLSDTQEDDNEAICEIITNWWEGYTVVEWDKDFKEMNKQTRRRRILKKRQRIKETGRREVIDPLSPVERHELL
ncbi:MAG: hypothetical protein IJ383_00170 [Bacteroidales bacterium]|nr:hypothetical protein [Bacteroidales bacterium]